MFAGWPRRDGSSKAYCCAPSQSAMARISASEKPRATRSITVADFCPDLNACMAATISSGLRPAMRATLLSTWALAGWQPVQDAAPDGAGDLALDLRLVDRVSGIGRRHDAVHLDLVSRDRDLGACRHVAVERHHLRQPAVDALRRRLAPARLLGHRIEHGEVARMLAH